MKTKHFFTILVALYSIMTATLTVNAQTIFYKDQLIESEIKGASDVHTVDLDGDEDIDILLASWGKSEIV
ncbi:MAG: hypothetical protein JNM36_10310, partial [Chitinophagales bacterium]|nr:hypothetical protein [Chitinophagales bacterium]